MSAVGDVGAEPATPLDLRLLPAAVTAWAGAAIAVALDEEGAWSLAAIGAGLGLGAVAVTTAARSITDRAARRPGGRCVRRARSIGRAVAPVVALMSIAIALVAALAAIEHPQRRPPELQAAFDRSGRVELVATITALPSSSNGSVLIRATATRVDDAEMHVPVVLFLPRHEPGPVPEIGSTIAATAKLRPTEPGDRTVALAFLADPPRILDPPHPLLALGNRIRTGFADAASALPQPGGSLVPGLAVGDERHVDDDLHDAMTVSSLTHLTAVSGSNVAIIVAAIIGLGRLANWPRTLRLAAAGTATALFVLLVTPQGSVLRAAVMAFIVLALEARSRRSAGVPILALAVIVLLAADPWLSRDYGFALSAAATAGLLLGTRPCTALLARWLPEPIALIIAVPTVAQLACQPILLLLDASLPTYGVVANLLAAPAAPIATVVGLIACLILPVAAPIAGVLMWVAWLPAHWIGMVAIASASLPFASVPWFDGLVGAVGFGALTAALVLLVFRVGPRWLHRGVAVVLAALLIVGTAIIAGQRAIIVRDRPVDWRIIACDVGQGDALLLRAGESIILVDTGKDAGVLTSCLDEFGVTAIDLLILSHFDHDHSGALLDLRIPIAAAWLPDTREARDQPETAALLRADIPLHFAAAGDVLEIGDVEIRAHWPMRRGDQPAPETSNEGSLVIETLPTGACVASCVSTLLLGDADRRAQVRLLRDVGPGHVDIVKMSHHGSADQAAELYAEIGAGLALLSVGADNGYGHPTKAALEMLHAAGTPWLRTDERGHLVVGASHGRAPELVVWTERQPSSGRSDRRVRRRGSGRRPPRRARR